MRRCEPLFRGAFENPEVPQRCQHGPRGFDRYNIRPFLAGVTAGDPNPGGDVVDAHFSTSRLCDLEQFLRDITIQNRLCTSRQPIVEKAHNLDRWKMLLQFRTKLPRISRATGNESRKKRSLISIFRAGACR